MGLHISEKHFASGTMTISNTAILISNAGLGFSAAQLAAAEVAYVFTATNTLRVLDTGAAPTATYGVPVTTTTGAAFYGNANVNNLQFIREAADGVVTVILGVSN